MGCGYTALFVTGSILGVCCIFVGCKITFLYFVLGRGACWSDGEGAWCGILFGGEARQGHAPELPFFRFLGLDESGPDFAEEGVVVGLVEYGLGL